MTRCEWSLGAWGNVCVAHQVVITKPLLKSRFTHNIFLLYTIKFRHCS